MSTPRATRTILAYAGAIVAAAFTFVASWLVIPAMLVQGLDPLRPDRLLMMSLIALAFAMVATGTALLPCFLADRLAERTGIRTAWYYALWGAITGVTLGPTVLALYAGSALDNGLELPAFWVDRFVVDLLNVGPAFALSGAVGGVTYQWINGRRAAVEA